MRVARKDGFVLALVIVALGLLGVVMAVLTGGANTMLFQADRAHVQAVERNLTASGLAWARYRSAQTDTVTSAEPAELDTSALADRQATLTVAFTEVGTDTVDVRIETTSAKGRHRLDASNDYVLPLMP
jgi:hypothetical protein